MVIFEQKKQDKSLIWACSISEFECRVTKSRFSIVVYSNCYSLVWYLIFFYMLRYFVIICLPSFVSCAYTTYIFAFYICVCVCQMNWFSNLITFYFFFYASIRYI